MNQTRRQRAMPLPGNLSSLTGAQVSGPMRPARERPHLVRDCAACKTARGASLVADAQKPSLGVTPGSPLAQLLGHPAMGRRLRRLLLSAIQAKDTPRRAHLQRQFQREAAAAGLAVSISR